MTTQASSRRALWAAPLPLTALTLVTGLAALILAAVLTGMGRSGVISNPGLLTQWGLPVARYIHHISMAVAVSAAILAAVALPARTGPRQRQKRRAGQEHPLFSRALLIAQTASVVWTMAALAVLVLSFSALAGLPVSAGEGFSAGFFDYAVNIATGQAWLSIVLIAALFSTLVAAVRNPAGLGFTAVLGLGAIVPMAMVGHSASGDDHTAAVNSLGLHLLGVVIWVGGLLVLALLAPQIARTAQELTARDQGGPQILGTLLRRYSVLAGLALVTVAASGVVNADLRIENLQQLVNTPYGLLLVLKAAATVILAAIGWMHRAWIIPRLAGPHTGAGAPRGEGSEVSTSYTTSRLLWQLILVEAAIMTAVIGISAVLGRTPPPVSEDLPPDATPARILTGYPLPPSPELANYFTQWRIDWLWLAVIIFLAVWYVRATVQVRRRGIRWPLLRAAAWLFGLLIFFWVTSGGPAVYGMVLFSGHMVQHMTLTMVVPIFLVLGSPVTLAMRALTPRSDGTRGAREWILWLVHSKWSKLVTHPVVAAVNFGGSIVLFYFTPVFGWSLEYHLGHIFMTVHFLLTGYIFALVLIGRDPLPSRPPHFLRVIILLATMVFHAFLAVVISGSEELIQAAWFGNMGHGWFPALMDQRRGGELMWGLGEIPAVLMGVIAAVQWSKDDTRESKRLDREADRSGDAELEDYNQMFAAMNQRNNLGR
ncbi:bifunctional copper resistance protein CopD/cytochrome c oxidase assembly protein [Nesterenkonia massiliensis]|uniref:Bifunctional copper resistance protein CopD/cytochrome c oxidase assembly protein n=1 Tax=Nesterenkonia massiliensis TaxID=1232429 RepID=A0ABT2HQ64_9MICC|nr:bifunctional copper resistance protein CopD/cytochrome c oxidase assembly protein [Nesterenkonia massiliensis]